MKISIHSRNPRYLFTRYMNVFKERNILKKTHEVSSNDHLSIIDIDNVGETVIGNKKSHLLLPLKFYNSDKDSKVHFLHSDSDMFAVQGFRQIVNNNDTPHILLLGVEKNIVEMTVGEDSMTEYDITNQFLRLSRENRYHIFELHHNNKGFSCKLYDIKYFNSIIIQQQIFKDQFIANIDSLDLLIVIKANNNIKIEDNFRSIFMRFFN